MRHIPVLRQWVTSGLVAAVATLMATSAASAYEGYWRYVETHFQPSEADLVAAAKNPGRQPEKHVSGGFQAEYSGQGSLELSFKDTDLDNHTYLSRMSFTYGTSVDMRVLVPNQRIDLTGNVSFESNFAGATGWGRVTVDNSDYVVSVTVGAGEQGSADGFFIVPSGAPGTTLRYVASAYISGYGGFNDEMTNTYEWVEGAVPSLEPSTPPDVVQPDEPTIRIDDDNTTTPDDGMDDNNDDSRWNVPSGPAGLLTDNWNTAACQQTDNVALDIDRDVRLGRFDLWIKWPADQRAMRYHVTKDGEDIGGGTVRRGACDPIQGEWCVGTDTPNAQLPPGRYVITIGTAAICQNSGSGGRGFIRAWKE